MLSDETRQGNVDEANESLAEAAARGDGDALRAIGEIAENWQQWTKAKDALKATNKQFKDKLDASSAGLREAVEKTIPSGASKQVLLTKLQGIEQAWQEVEEVKAESKEEKKEARAQVRRAEDRLDRSVAESAQLALDFRAMQ